MPRFLGFRGAWRVLFALVIATVALGTLIIQSVRRESAARLDVVVDTYRDVADFVSTRLSAVVADDEREIDAAVSNAPNADALVDALAALELKRSWLQPLVVSTRPPIETLALEETDPAAIRFQHMMNAAEGEELRLQNLDGAVREYTRAIDAAPTTTDKLRALNGLARTEFKAGRPDRAARVSRQLLDAADYLKTGEAMWAVYAHDRLIDCAAGSADRSRQHGHALAFFEFLVRYRYVLDQDTVTYYTQRVRDTLEGAELTSGAHLTFQRLNERETALRPNDAAIRSRSASTSSTRANVAYPLPTHVEKAVKDILATNGPWSGRGIAVVDTAGQPIFSSATLVPKDAAAATELILPHGWRVLAFPQSGSIATLVARDANRYALWMVLVFGTVVAALVLAARSVARELMLARLRAEFVAGVSHELKTPLSLIRMFGESLREGWVAESKKQDYYEVITRESERLTGLINNVLDFSRLESGTRGYAFDAVDLRPLVQDILNRYEFHLRAANIDLVRDLPDMPFSARADRDAVEQVIVNLLSNAVKYMGEPDRQPREIRVSLSREGRAAVLRVGDTGIGISEENRRYIFDRFYRSDDERVRAVTGSGLGLTLVKAHVDAHAGMIVVDSVPNQGSTFSIFLPLAEAVPA